MNNDTTLAAPYYFSAEVLRELLDRAKRYKKLSLTYLISLGAIITALQLSVYTLIEITANFWFVILASALLLIVDSVIEEVILNDWIATKENKPLQYKSAVWLNICKFQSLLHLSFIIFILAIIIGFSRGYSAADEEYRLRASIQDAVEIFISNNGYPPSSIYELFDYQPDVAQTYSLLKGEPIRFETMNNNDYRIIFAGRDKKLDTPDDYVATPELKLRDIIREFDMRNSCSK